MFLRLGIRVPPAIAQVGGRDRIRPEVSSVPANDRSRGAGGGVLSGVRRRGNAVRKIFAICWEVLQAWGMTTPLALVFYENLLPGSQLVNRLQDLGYRVQTVSDIQTLVAQALQGKPLVVVVDLASAAADVCGIIRELKRNPETRHIPVIAFTDLKNEGLQTAATTAGATMVAGSDAILDQLPELLEQALQVE